MDDCEAALTEKPQIQTGMDDGDASKIAKKECTQGPYNSGGVY